MNSIPFTQYLRPHGDQEAVTIDMEDQELHDKAEALIEADYHFDIEELTTGMVSMTCERDTEKDDFHIQLCPNGPEVVDAVRALVENAYKCLP